MDIVIKPKVEWTSLGLLWETFLSTFWMDKEDPPHLWLEPRLYERSIPCCPIRLVCSCLRWINMRRKERLELSKCRLYLQDMWRLIWQRPQLFSQVKLAKHFESSMRLELKPQKRSRMTAPGLNTMSLWSKRLSRSSMVDPILDRSVWLQGLKTFDTVYPNSVRMTAREPTACDDPRVSGFPCFAQHKEGRQRGNQHGAWTQCLKCGLRLSYISKKGMHGDSRAMGPDPAVIRFAMQELEANVTASQVNSDMVNGKIMEVKGKMLQAGIKTPVALNMTYAEYLKRIAKNGRADGYQETNPITQTGLHTPPRRPCRKWTSRNLPGLWAQFERMRRGPRRPQWSPVQRPQNRRMDRTFWFPATRRSRTRRKEQRSRSEGLALAGQGRFEDADDEERRVGKFGAAMLWWRDMSGWPLLLWEVTSWWDRDSLRLWGEEWGEKGRRFGWHWQWPGKGPHDTRLRLHHEKFKTHKIDFSRGDGSAWTSWFFWEAGQHVEHVAKASVSFEQADATCILEDGEECCSDWSNGFGSDGWTVQPYEEVTRLSGGCLRTWLQAFSWLREGWIRGKAYQLPWRIRSWIHYRNQDVPTWDEAEHPSVGMGVLALHKT